MSILIRLIALSALVVGAGTLHAAQLLLFSFDGATGDEEEFLASTHVEHLGVSAIARGEGLNPSAAAGAFGARDWSIGGLGEDDYFEFSVVPELGYELGLTAIQIDERRSSTGIGEWTVRSSLDDFATDLTPGPFLIGDNTNTRVDQQVVFDAENYSNLQEQILLRIYGYEAESSVATWRIDNVELFGSLTAVPEPNSLIIGLTMAGAAMFVRFFRWRYPTV